jgi:hypothetical protein
VGRAYVPVVAAVLFLGCAYASTYPKAVGPHKEIASSARLWVLTPSDGIYGTERYPGSGQSVARLTLAAVRKRIPLAQSGRRLGEAEALKEGARRGVDFIVSPEILHWENRATPWSGMRDKVRVEIRLLSVRPPKLISRVVFESRNNSITLIDGRPEDLLDDDYEKTVLDLL